MDTSTLYPFKVNTRLTCFQLGVIMNKSITKGYAGSLRGQLCSFPLDKYLGMGLLCKCMFNTHTHKLMSELRLILLYLPHHKSTCYWFIDLGRRHDSWYKGCRSSYRSISMFASLLLAPQIPWESYRRPTSRSRCAVDWFTEVEHWSWSIHLI